MQANLRYPQSVQRAVIGAKFVVNAVGVLASGGKQTFRAIHVDGPRAIAKAAREAGVRHLVHISAIGADAKSSSRYARSKAAGEAAVLEEFPGAIIVRPSIVFGPEDQFFNRFAAMARMSPLLPLIGGGRTRFQPVFVGDLGAAVAAIAAGAGKPGTIYEAGGPEVLSFRELLDLTQEWSGRSRGYLRMPFWLAKLQALLTWPLPNTLRPDHPRSGAHAPARQRRQRGGKERRPHPCRPRHHIPARRRRHRADVSGALPRPRSVRQLPHMSRTAD